MSNLSIIIVVVLIIVIAIVAFKVYVPDALFLNIDKSYSEFAKDHQGFDQKQLVKLRDDIERAIYQLGYTIPNRETFIESNSDPEYSEYAGNVRDVEISVQKDKERISQYQKMLIEIDREYNRREHARKYK